MEELRARQELCYRLADSMEGRSSGCLVRVSEAHERTSGEDGGAATTVNLISRFRFRTSRVRSAILILATCYLSCPIASAQSSHVPEFARSYTGRRFDYAEFMRFDAPAPPKDGIYQSNGFLALRESGFGGQVVVIPAQVEPLPTNTSNRLSAAEVDAPEFTDSFGRKFSFADSPATRTVSYYADRTVYRASFDGGPSVTLIVYPIYRNIMRAVLSGLRGRRTKRITGEITAKRDTFGSHQRNSMPWIGHKTRSGQ